MDAIISIENIENTLAEKHDDCDFFRAFTSKYIVKKILTRDGIKIDLINEALQRILDIGYKEIIVQSTHVINGIEYDKIIKEVQIYKGRFDSITVGSPLLSGFNDYINICDIIDKSVGARFDNEAILLMGHGTAHFSNACYSKLENTFEFMGIDNVFVACVEGFPEIEYTIKKLMRKGIDKLICMPFMIVAGDHAKNDMAGDEDDSWKNLLEQAGFEVNVRLSGLGQIPGIAELFYQHSRSGKAI